MIRTVALDIGLSWSAYEVGMVTGRNGKNRSGTVGKTLNQTGTVGNGKRNPFPWLSLLCNVVTSD